MLQMAVSGSLNEKLEIIGDNLRTNIENGLGNNNFEFTDNGDGSYKVKINSSNRLYYIEENGNIISPENMIEIGTAEELKTFRDEVNAGNTYEGWYIYLANDINLDLAENENWEPIGIYDENSTDPDDEINMPFKGIFDGCFNTISGINTDGTLKNRGLFGLIKESTIKNIGIVNSNIQGTSRTGAVVGYAYQNSKIINCYNSSNISSTDNFLGGIAGFIRENTIIESCYNNGNLVSTGGAIGGIVGGISNSEVKNCYNAGAIEGDSVGGISGAVYTKALIQNCYNIGSLKSTENFAFAINCSYNSLVTFKNNYYLENTVNESNDMYEQTECIVKNNQEMKNLYSILGDAFKADNENINDGYPILSWQ